MRTRIHTREIAFSWFLGENRDKIGIISGIFLILELYLEIVLQELFARFLFRIKQTYRNTPH